MAGLVAYASSDDEEDNTSQHAPSAEQRIHQTDETKTPPTKEVTAKEGTTDNSKQGEYSALQTKLTKTH
jgi:hypothetical protein